MTVLRRLGLLFIGLLLASILLFMYIQSGAQQAASYIESRDLVRQLKQQDAIWDNEVLKSRMALSDNYDPLVSPLNEMARLWQRLDAIESDPARHVPSSWEQERDEYLKAVKEKTRLVDSNPTMRYCAIPSPSCPPPKMTSRPSSANFRTPTNCSCKTLPSTPTTCCSAPWSSPI